MNGIFDLLMTFRFCFSYLVLLNVSKHKPVRETSKALWEICSLRIMGLRKNKFLWLFPKSSYLPFPTIYSCATSTFSIMHLICPPKVCTTFVFHFSRVLQPSQEKLKIMLMQTFGWGVNKVIMGNVKEACEEVLAVQSWQVRVYIGSKKRE